MNKVCTIVEWLKKEAKESKHSKPKMYVVGSTNSGKSSFLNALIHKISNNPRMKENEEQKVYDREKWNPNEIHRNSKGKEMEGMLKNHPKTNTIIKQLLTVSPLPGTTMDFIQVEDLHVGFKVYDTPGIPQKHQVGSHIEDFQDLVSMIPIKKILSKNFTLWSGTSIWIGALARLDFVSGNDLKFCFCFQHDVTLHTSGLLKAEEVYLKQAGNLLRPSYNAAPETVEFLTHEFAIECREKELIDKEIAISGLGWIGVTGTSRGTFWIHLPKHVTFNVWDALLKFEI